MTVSDLNRKIADVLEVLHHVAMEIERADRTLPEGAGATLVYLAALRGMSQEYLHIFHLITGEKTKRKPGPRIPTSVEDLIKRWTK